MKSVKEKSEEYGYTNWQSEEYHDGASEGLEFDPIGHTQKTFEAGANYVLEQLPYEVCDDDGNSLYLQINKEDDVYQLVYTDPYGDFESIETDRYEHFVDACYKMVIRLHKLNLL